MAAGEGLLLVPTQRGLVAFGSGVSDPVDDPVTVTVPAPRTVVDDGVPATVPVPAIPGAVQGPFVPSTPVDECATGNVVGRTLTPCPTPPVTDAEGRGAGQPALDAECARWLATAGRINSRIVIRLAEHPRTEARKRLRAQRLQQLRRNAAGYVRLLEAGCPTFANRPAALQIGPR
jgi:hypothetical protein